MGKEKTTLKEMRPSTTRGGTDLPSRPNFSPNVTSAVITKKKGKVSSSSPLSKMSTSTENDLICGSIDKEVTPETSETTETPELPESSIIENVESDLEDNESFDDEYETSSYEEEDAIAMAFMDSNLDKLDKLDSNKNSSLADYFPVTKKMNAPAIKIKDKDYEFSVDPEIIKKAEKFKFNGRDNEFPFEHIAVLHDLSVLFGKDEIHQRYYFLKLFPFTLGGDAKTWYNSLEPGSITSKEECLQLFYNKYFPADKIHGLTIEISKFSQKEKEDLPQAWGRYSKMVRKCPTHVTWVYILGTLP